MGGTMREGNLHPSWGIMVSGLLLLGACAQQNQTASIAQPKPGKYTVEPASEWGHPEPEAEMDQLMAPYNPLTGAGEADQIKAQFRGKDRKAAKTSIADTEVEEFASLGALVHTLQSEDAMRNHDPEITEDETMDRVDEERRNVRVPAFICAIKYEADQDWHIIGAADADCDGPTFFNFEVSGLPKSSAASHDQLLDARNQLADLLDHDLPGPGTYRQYKETGPIPVIIQGSLFYDVDHVAGVVGPQGMRPKTSWEVHPVTSISPQ
jgi:hypothetical protein